jgi:hypothetical protein
VEELTIEGMPWAFVAWLVGHRTAPGWPLFNEQFRVTRHVRMMAEAWHLVPSQAVLGKAKTLAWGLLYNYN